MRGLVNSYKNLNPIWHEEIQKVKFISILENQEHLYIHFLRAIVRYCIVKDDYSVDSITKQMSFLYSDVFEIKNILRSGKLFNMHLSKLIAAFKASQHDIKTELDNFANEPDLDINIDDNSNIINDRVLSKWYHIESQTYIATPESEIQGELFKTTKRCLNTTIVTEKSLKYLNNNDTFLCIEKEIYLYHEHQLNENDYIIKFHGYSVYNCKMMMFYDYAEYGDLFTYFQVNHNSSGNILKDWKEKIKLAWEISQGVKYLHDRKVLHLDLRSANILLNFDETGEGLIPKISNFLWSRDSCFNKTFVNPKIPIPSKEKIWKRWYDPDRLLNEESGLASSDIYSLGLLFWEIAWCKAGNLPFNEIPIKNLHAHLQKKNQEKMPELPLEYRRWKDVVSKMCHLKSGDRYRIMSVETIMGNLFKGRSISISSNASSATYRSQLLQFCRTYSSDDTDYTES
ncbi:kinase-like domain-containing protein [Glomus cerebriforme]|uniref:Kinase-like domain-containing protein n=1 Tax=Glomus cerebriforme TaxID=658196 RepID=A0A397SG87_9GLOM|nr:kinase-like domain-containing protein [Glomus cerebriforme]RIA86558.1 kinase-like domain-containing protein [Glomus cerebriforme]